MNQADANSLAAISGNLNKPDQKPSAEDFQWGCCRSIRICNSPLCTFNFKTRFIVYGEQVADLNTTCFLPFLNASECN